MGDYIPRQEYGKHIRIISAFKSQNNRSSGRYSPISYVTVQKQEETTWQKIKIAAVLRAAQGRAVRDVPVRAKRLRA